MRGEMSSEPDGAHPSVCRANSSPDCLLPPPGSRTDGHAQIAGGCSAELTSSTATACAGAMRPSSMARAFEWDCGASGAAKAPETLGSRWLRWSRMGAFDRIMDGLASGVRDARTVMIDAILLKAHQTASSLRVSAAEQKAIRGIVSPGAGSMNSKLHAVASHLGRPISYRLAAGHRQGTLLCNVLPGSRWATAGERRSCWRRCRRPSG